MDQTFISPTIRAVVCRFIVMLSVFCVAASCTTHDENVLLDQTTNNINIYPISIVGVIGGTIQPQPSEWSTPGAAGSRTFEVYGSFPMSTGLTYRAHVLCNGRLWPTQIIAGYDGGHINVAIPNIPSEFPPGTSCWFMFELSDAGTDKYTRVQSNSSYSNWFGAVSVGPTRVTSGQDFGIATGWHTYELRGSISAALSYTAQAWCNGLYATTHVMAHGDGWARIRFSSTGTVPRGCTLILYSPSDPIGVNKWTIREGPTAPTVPSYGLYYWGGYQPDAEPPSYTQIGSPSRALSSGARTIAATGYRQTMRFVMEPQMRLPSWGKMRAIVATAPNYLFPVQMTDGNPYGQAGFCPPSDPGRPSFLECAARSSEYQGAFNSVVTGGTVFLTARDEVSGGELGERGDYYLDESRMIANQAAIRNEYRDLTLALYQTQKGTGRTFVINSYETDNFLYSPSPGDYVRNWHRTCTPGTVVTACGSGYVCESGHCVSPSNVSAMVNGRLSALTFWFKLRQEGIQAGRQLAAAQGLTGVTVVDGIETSGVRMLRDINAVRVLSAIVPSVRPAYVTYSAWDSTSLRGSLDEDLMMIEQTLGTIGASPLTGVRPYLALGELGIERWNSTPERRWRMRETAKAGYRSYVARPTSPSPGPPFSILWFGFDTGAGFDWLNENFNVPAGWPYNLALKNPPVNDPNEGLLQPHGEEHASSAALREELLAYISSGTLPPQSTRIQNMTDLGLTDGQHHFEIWGSFPNAASSTYTATAICDGFATPATVYYQNPNDGQLNVRINDPGWGACSGNVYEGRWCTFVVHSPAGSSPIFGPRHVCPAAQGQNGQNWDGACNRSCP